MTKAAKNTETRPCRCSIYTAVTAEITDEHGEMVDIEEIGTGCTATTKNEFAQGHDAKLKSFLIKAGIRGLEVAKVEGGLRMSSDAANMAREYGFADMVVEGIRKGVAKALAAQDRANRKHEAQAAKAAPKAKAPAEPVVEVVDTARDVIAKVGRWTYKGTEDQGTFTYQSKLGGRKTTDKYEVVEVL